MAISAKPSPSIEIPRTDSLGIDFDMYLPLTPQQFRRLRNRQLYGSAAIQAERVGVRGCETDNGCDQL